jgi:hypothetical protein
MADRTREVDDLDYLLRDALWSDDSGEPIKERVFFKLRARIQAERRGAHRPKLIAAPIYAGPSLSASYWYLAPLTRVMR